MFDIVELHFDEHWDTGQVQSGTQETFIVSLLLAAALES